LRCSEPHQAQHFNHLHHHVFQCLAHSKRGRRYHRWQRRHHLLRLRRRCISHRRQQLGGRELFELVELRGVGLWRRKSGGFGVWTHLRLRRSGRCLLRRLRARVVSKRYLVAHVSANFSYNLFSSSVLSWLASRRRPLDDVLSVNGTEYIQSFTSDTAHGVCIAYCTLRRRWKEMGNA
jgi:hypothetical protein